MFTPVFVKDLVVPMEKYYKHRSRHIAILTTRTVANKGVNISPLELQELLQTQE
jgi:hypothetical protein